MDDVRATWDALAEDFDLEPDHGLADPHVRAAWRDLLAPLLPPPGARAADLGCGTGSLALLLAEAGLLVDGIDLSPRMVERARDKTAGHAGVAVAVGDASAPQLAPAAYDVVLARHVVWALPDPAEALARWVDLLVDGGRLVLVEGRWGTGAGIAADRLVALLPPTATDVEVTALDDPALWGRAVDDERYLVSARRERARRGEGSR